jgi:putative addiction module component (TIGR02574 family)
VKDAVIALLDRLPDDCSVDDVIDRLYELTADAGGEDFAPLSAPQRAELDRRLARLASRAERLIPWEAVRAELARDE